MRTPRSTLPFLAAVAAMALVACDLRPELESDPAYWNPAPLAAIDAAPPAPEAGADGDAGDPGEGCEEEPPFDEALVTSLAGGTSHLAGTPCLTGCHEEGGSARKVFVAAGTVYVSEGSRQVARSGEVHGIGNTTLSVDRCGNFYASPGSLKAKLTSTYPYVRNPVLHRMERALARSPDPGNCNQADCHDFSARNKVGIYF